MEVTKSLRLAFDQKFVRVVLKDVHAFIIEKMEDGNVQTRGSAVMHGFFLDYDEHFIYLGSSSGEIDQAVAINNIAVINKEDVMELDEEVAAFLSFPESDEEIN